MHRTFDPPPPPSSTAVARAQLPNLSKRTMERIEKDLQGDEAQSRARKAHAEIVGKRAM